MNTTLPLVVSGAFRYSHRPRQRHQSYDLPGGLAGPPCPFWDVSLQPDYLGRMIK